MSRAGFDAWPNQSCDRCKTIPAPGWGEGEAELGLRRRHIGDRAMAEPVRRQDIVRTGVGAAPWAKPESRLSRSYAGTNKSFGYEGVMLAS